MQFSKIVMTSLLGFALGSPIDKRTPAEIEADIATVSSDLTSFNTAINAFTGSLLQALSLLTSYNTLSSSIDAATAEITSTGALAAADSATIYADVDSLTAQITDTLSDATAKVRLCLKRSAVMWLWKLTLCLFCSNRLSRRLATPAPSARPCRRCL